MKKRVSVSAASEIKLLAFMFMKTARQDIGRRLKARGAGVNPLGFGVLNMVRHGKRTLSDLSRETMLAPATLVPVINTLERKGLIERQRDERDRRRSPLRLTKRGEKIMAGISFIGENDLITRNLKKLGERDVSELQRILRKLVGGLIGEKKMKEMVESHMTKAGD
ncbi:MAG TPA: MarR family winged helix-turn-helix transcriptional regulator [Candidatus Paceibacterota bacterium]|nr:MarR family winged helix-turn-helix transcriptional regulator [Candidatus Paceibacterota bacterium]